LKRFCAAVLILLFLFSASLVNSFCLARFTTDLTSLLDRAHHQASMGNWDEAGLFVRTAREQWDGKSFYLHTTLRHGDIDEIDSTFEELSGLLEHREEGEYSAVLSRLACQLDLLRESEAFTLQNIL